MTTIGIERVPNHEWMPQSIKDASTQEVLKSLCETLRHIIVPIEGITEIRDALWERAMIFYPPKPEINLPYFVSQAIFGLTDHARDQFIQSTKEITQEWKCGTCAKSGTVSYEKGISAMDVVHLIAQDHAEASPVLCTAPVETIEVPNWNV